jgi:serine/threonine protein kinase
MPGLEQYVGQVLDDKYRLEQLLGQGGMGAVFLATHLGTERYVALKLIAPQFMRNEEFVERFKREARAAGRLRHPNVVDVTDFGFADAKGGQVAYLVMEYLDGCTLGDVLAEEQRLPVEWVVDILEQVCSAVHEAHHQGIVHRDLKPDNIWLEPNRLGGYRVKVLDFGIAKLAEATAPPSDEELLAIGSVKVPVATNVAVVAAQTSQNLPHPNPADLEKATLLQTANHPRLPYDGDELITQRLELGSDDHARGETPHTGEMAVGDLSVEANENKLFAAQTSHRGPANPTEAWGHRREQLEDLDVDKDGTLLFSNETRSAGPHTAHIFTTPQGSALTRVGAIMGTPLYMSPEQCGGGNLDARSDVYSLGVIAYQMLAGEPPFGGNTSTVMKAHREEAPAPLREKTKKLRKRAAQVVMTALAKDPADRPQTAAAFASSLRAQADGIGSLYRRAFALYSEYLPKFLRLSLIAHIPVIVFTVLILALDLTESVRHRSFKAKVIWICVLALVGLLQVASYFVAASSISGMTAVIVAQLTAAPLRPVQLSTAFAVLKRRWRPFLNTSIRMTLRIMLGWLLIIPGMVMTIRYYLYAPVVLLEGLEKKGARVRARQLASRSWRTVIMIALLQVMIPVLVSLLIGRVSFHPGDKLTESASHKIFQHLSGLVNIVVVPLVSIVPALLYLKMRQLGGEPLSDLLPQIEDEDAGRSKWQQRMRTRVSLHTPQGQKTTGQKNSGPKMASS